MTLVAATAVGLLVPVGFHCARSAGRIPLERLLSRRTGEMMEASSRFHENRAEIQAQILSELRSILRNSQDADRRFRSALALHQLQPAGVEEDFLAALKDNSAAVRASAATSLGAYGYEPAVPDLIGLLKDSDLTVRRSAIYALGEIGSPHCIDALKSIPAALLEDPLTRQRVQAALEATNGMKR